MPARIEQLLRRVFRLQRVWSPGSSVLKPCWSESIPNFSKEYPEWPLPPAARQSSNPIRISAWRYRIAGRRLNAFWAVLEKRSTGRQPPQLRLWPDLCLSLRSRFCEFLGLSDAFALNPWENVRLTCDRQPGLDLGGVQGQEQDTKVRAKDRSVLLRRMV